MVLRMLSLKEFFLLEKLDLSSLNEDEHITFRRIRKIYKEFVHYKHKTRNPNTGYAKRKFTESYHRWTSTIKEIRQKYGMERGKYIISMVTQSISMPK